MDNPCNFQWLGSPCSSTKNRNHYLSFQRNGVQISVHDFVYILAEANTRLVAYLEDMYQDTKDNNNNNNNMVVVRWYHKIDELPLVFPHNYNHREVFFSLSLQDLSIECIDGLASILSPQHLHTYLNNNAPTHSNTKPFVCQSQFQNHKLVPFDITRVQGYWKQDIFSSIYPFPPAKGLLVEENTHGYILPPKKRQCTETTQSATQTSLMACQTVKVKPFQYCQVGSRVEVLSQHSGMRGCWFRGSVIKKSKDKLKVRYHDIQDVDDESNKVEEWVLASRIASADQLGLRICGRLVLRPSPVANSKDRVTWAIDVGTVVDVWQHDGWWEGIVVQKQSDDKFRVFFPGEKLDSLFSRGELRHSQDWCGSSGWTQLKERKDLIPSILSNLLDVKQVSEEPCHGSLTQVTTNCESRVPSIVDSGLKDTHRNTEALKNDNVKDLSKDNFLTQLKWKTSKKRKRCDGSYVHDKRSVLVPRTRERFMMPSMLKFDRDNCTFSRDSVVTSWVMSS